MRASCATRRCSSGTASSGYFRRDAIGHDGATAAGLFTIGTPFNGSFGASTSTRPRRIYLNARMFLSHHAAVGARRRAHTSSGRGSQTAPSGLHVRADNLNIRPTGCRHGRSREPPPHPFANDPSGYYSPTTGSSICPAHSARRQTFVPTHAALLESTTTPASRRTSRLRHPFTRALQSERRDRGHYRPRGLGGRLALSRRTRTRGIRTRGHGLASGKPARVVIHLQSVAVRSLKPGSPLQIAAGTSLLSPTRSRSPAVAGRSKRCRCWGRERRVELPPARSHAGATLTRARADAVMSGNDRPSDRHDHQRTKVSDRDHRGGEATDERLPR